MEITLVRHGKSQHSENHKITSEEFRGWVTCYDAKGVLEEAAYPIQTLEKVRKANLVVTSDLKRSIDSAKLLKSGLQLSSKALFRETELPALLKTLVELKLSPRHWAILLRIFWVCGYSKRCESLADARVRAGKAANELIDKAKEHHSVVLVGHGFFNRLIAKELQKNGWVGNQKIRARHWYGATYTKELD